MSLVFFLKLWFEIHMYINMQICLPITPPTSKRKQVFRNNHHLIYMTLAQCGLPFIFLNLACGYWVFSSITLWKWHSTPLCTVQNVSIAIVDQHCWPCRFKPSHTGPRRFAFPSPSLTKHGQRWTCSGVGPSCALPPQTNACCKLILNSCLWRKPERWIFLKVSVFCPQYFCSFWLNLFCFTHPVWTFKHLLCYTVTSCSLLALLRVTQTHHFLQCCFITKALEWLNNRVL